MEHEYCVAHDQPLEWCHHESLPHECPMCGATTHAACFGPGDPLFDILKEWADSLPEDGK